MDILLGLRNFMGKGIFENIMSIFLLPDCVIGPASVSFLRASWEGKSNSLLNQTPKMCSK